MKKLTLTLLSLTVFITLLYKVGNTVVNLIMTLIPESASDWFPIIKLILWIATFSFDVFVTIVIIYICLFVASLFVSK